uniref:Putative plant transposon protein domain-containing protein n=1 Tax=Solanum tuberosum TaxID=4113 RepID=M1D997_SOLTU
MRWIAGQIAVEGEAATWVANSHVHITKASLTIPAKVRWAVVHAQLQPTGNDNTLSPSLASLLACIMDRYPLTVGIRIAMEMRDRALNERASQPFSCLIRRLCACQRTT